MQSAMNIMQFQIQKYVLTETSQTLIARPPMGVEKLLADFQPTDMRAQLLRQLAGSINFGHINGAIDRVFFHLNFFCRFCAPLV